MPFIRAADLFVHYVEAGVGDPIVFVHGNWTTSTSWEPVLKRLPIGWRGIAYDVRGRGKTLGPDSNYTLPELAGDLQAFADALGMDRFHLVGHSLGSTIAMQFGLDNPGRLKTLTLIAPAWVDGMPRLYSSPLSQRALKASKTLFAQGLRTMMPTLRDDELMGRLVEEGHQQRITASLRSIPALLHWRPGNRLRKIDAPKLAITGQNDRLTGGSNARRAVHALGARHVIILGSGHSPNVEAPETFVQVLIAHLSEAEGSSREAS